MRSTARRTADRSEFNGALLMARDRLRRVRCVQEWSEPRT